MRPLLWRALKSSYIASARDRAPRSSDVSSAHTVNDVNAGAVNAAMIEAMQTQQAAVATSPSRRVEGAGGHLMRVLARWPRSSDSAPESDARESTDYGVYRARRWSRAQVVALAKQVTSVTQRVTKVTGWRRNELRTHAAQLRFGPLGIQSVKPLLDDNFLACRQRSNLLAPKATRAYAKWFDLRVVRIHVDILSVRHVRRWTQPA